MCAPTVSSRSCVGKSEVCRAVKTDGCICACVRGSGSGSRYGRSKGVAARCAAEYVWVPGNQKDMERRSWHADMEVSVSWTELYWQGGWPGAAVSEYS